MNMNKIMAMLVFMLVCFLPTGVNATGGVVSKSVSYSCKCTNEGGRLVCANNNCTRDIAIKKMLDKCGPNTKVGDDKNKEYEPGTIKNITFTCGGYSGSSPEEACTTYNNNGFFGGVNQHIGVRASATCFPGAPARVGAEICHDAQETMRFLGFLLLFIRILIPFAIILMGTLDFYKIAMSGKPDEDMKKQAITLGKRVIAGILIFFLPTFLNMLFVFVSGWSDIAAEYETCANCLLSPSQCQ